MGVMSNEQTRSHGVMEGKGAYNRYAKLPAGVGASAQVARSLCTTLTNRRTTSTCYSLFWMLTRTDTSWTTQTYFRVRSEDHSTRAFSRPARFILVGPRTPRCG